HGAEDCALEQQRQDQLAPSSIGVLGVGRRLLVEQRPQARERPLADEAGQQAAERAERTKEEPAHGGCFTRRGVCVPRACSRPAQSGREPPGVSPASLALLPGAASAGSCFSAAGGGSSLSR